MREGSENEEGKKVEVREGSVFQTELSLAAVYLFNIICSIHQ